MRVKESHGRLILLLGAVCLPSFLGYGLGIWSLVLSDGTRIEWFLLLGALSIGVLLAACYRCAVFLNSIGVPRNLPSQSVPQQPVLWNAQKETPHSAGNPFLNLPPELDSDLPLSPVKEGRFFSGNELLIIDVKVDGVREGSPSPTRGLQ